MKIIEAPDNLFKVESSKGNKFYDVQIDNRLNTCTCPHFIYRCQQHGLACKHILAVLNLKEA